jgi:DNA helicase II / ATP-dependent DNA helicase PcrA
MQSTNTIVIAAAGSGKTTSIVDDAAVKPQNRYAITTFTINNCNQIKGKFFTEHGAIPSHVSVTTWFSFLLRDFVRPYQNFVYSKKRITELCFVQGRSAPYVSKTDIERYFFTSGCRIFSDKISEFAVTCNEKSNGRVVGRVAELYDEIIIDEVQDLAGYDLEILELLLKANIRVSAVGDIRQATYATNNSAKNKQFAGAKIIERFQIWEKKRLCRLEYRAKSYRCNQQICDFADALYPRLPKTESVNQKVTGHDGIFILSKDQVVDYVRKYSPKVLRFDKKTDCGELTAMNFGESKGLSFDRVLIFPNGPISKFLKSGDIQHVNASSAKFYVAITRARYSIGFVYDGTLEHEHKMQIWGYALDEPEPNVDLN